MFKKVALILALFACITFAQNQKEGPFVGIGSKAVLFNFSGLSNLGANNFDGGAGIKFFIASPMALRFGVMVNVAGSTTPANTTTVNPVGVDGSSTSTSFGVEAALEYHFNFNRLTPYFGGGIGFSSGTTEVKQANVGPTAPVYQITTKDGAGTTINFFALMGVEYFIVNEISLAAEYRLGYWTTSPSDVVVSSSNPNVPSVTTKGTSSHALYLNSNNPLISSGILTLAVYF